MPQGSSNFTTPVVSGLDSHTGGSPYGFAEVVNLLATTLNGAHTDAVGTITVVSTTGFPSRGTIVVDSEAISYTGTTATEFTGATRGADGTTAASHSSGATVSNVPVARNHNDLAAAIVALENAVVATGQSAGIINGNFNVWQRGTSFAAIATGAYFADRWVYNNASAAAHTASRSTDVPAVAAQSPLQNYSALIDCTTADASIAAGDLCLIQQKIEGYNFLPYAQRQFTLSFWVKGTKTGIHCVSFVNSAGDRSYVAEYTINTTATWEYKTITVSASPSAGTWNYTTGIGLQIGFALNAGTTYQTTANAWQTGNFYATSNQVTATDSTSNDFRIAMVQLDLGPYAFPFRTRPAGQEVALCQRYCYVAGATQAFQSLGAGYCQDTVDAQIHIPLPVTMRTTPTLTFPSATDFDICHAATTTTTTAIAASVLGVTSADALGVKATVAAGLTAGQGVTLRSRSTTTGIIIATAEL